MNITTIAEKLDKDFKELIKGSSIFFVFRVLGMAVTYGFTLAVTRTLGAGAWGIFVLCLTILQVTAVFGRFGLDTALLKFIAQYNAQGKGGAARAVYFKSITLTIPISLCLSVILYLLSPFISEKIFRKEYLIPYIRLISIGVLPFVLLYINSESLRALKKIRDYVIFQNLLPFLISLLSFLILFSYYFNKHNSNIVISSYLFGLFWAFILSLIFLLKEFRKMYKIKKIEEKISYKEVFSVSFPMFISSSLGMILAWTDTIMLGIWRTETEVGIYNVALKLSGIISFVLIAVNSIVAPKFAEFWGVGEINKLKKLAKQSANLMFYFSFPLFLFLFFFSSSVLNVFGKEFITGSNALKILIVGQFINVICGSVGWILQMTKYQNFHQKIVLISTLLNIVLNYLLIPRYGITGAAFASATSMIFWNLIFTVKVKNILGEWIIYVPFSCK